MQENYLNKDSKAALKMKKPLLCIGTMAVMALSGNAAAQQFEEFYGKVYDVSCGRVVFEEIVSNGKKVKYNYEIQKNCLKVPEFSEEELTELIERRYKGYKIEIFTFDRASNNINDILAFRIWDNKGKLIENTLYEASDVTGRVSSKLMDIFEDSEFNKEGCDGVYDFKSLGLPPSKKNPMQREAGQDLEKLCNYLLHHKAKRIINKHIKQQKKR